MLRYLDMLILIAWYGFVVLGSAPMLVRISRGKCSYPGQAGGLPEKWARWIVGEERPRKTGR
jgi:hypothetical protein